MKILLATTNRFKVREITEIIPDVEFLAISDFTDHWEVEEVGATFEENSLLKAKTAAHYFGIISIADDSGLEIPILSYFPGVQSSRFLEGRPFEEKMKAVLERMSSFDKPEERVARFRTVATYYDPLTGQSLSAEGVVEGSIAERISGDNGFGYDPIFIPKGFDSTFGELTDVIKNNFSHRSRAFHKLFERIKSEALP